MTVFRKFIALAISLLFSVVVLGCEREGPMERTGEKADEAVEETKDAFTKDGPMERAGERVDQATEDMKKD